MFISAGNEHQWNMSTQFLLPEPAGSEVEPTAKARAHIIFALRRLYSAN